MSKKKRAAALARHPHTDERLVIRVHLVESEPLIWRRIVLDPELTLYQVHEVLQIAFEWENDHLHHFIKQRSGKPHATYAPPWDVLKNSPYPSQDVDESTVKVGSLIRRIESQIAYDYDPRVDWLHVLTVEERRLATDDEPRASLLAGEMAAPGEFAGNIYLYNEMVEAWRNPRHPDRKAWLEEIEETHVEPFAPDRFDLERLQAKLAASLENNLESWDPTIEPVFSRIEEFEEFPELE